VAKTSRHRQLTAFLPQPLGDQVDSVRRRWDPVMSDKIDAHFTVCHDLSDDQLEMVGSLHNERPLRVRITRARVWGEPSLGIYLDVEDSHGTVRGLREALVIDNQPDMSFRPHVTLTHPRTTPPEIADTAWSALESWRLDIEVEIGSLDVVEFDGRAWQTVRKVILGEGR
jgi:2'-5' RNA ligase